MTSLKTKNIWFLAAFLFLSIVPTLARVVPQGTWPTQGCHQFLRPQGHPPDIRNIVPQNIWANGNIQNPYRYRIICQTFNGVPGYLTLYDIDNKIPVFSAYEYRGSLRGRPNVTWMTEPQLDQAPNQNNINMRTGVRNIVNQAKNADYDNNNPGYDKGHLFPVRHGSTQDDKISTFTLTNAVPQEETFNRGRWNTMEHCMKCIMDNYIIRNQMNCFVVVGAIPDNNPINNLNGVNIPTIMWSAFFCANQQGQNIQSGAYWSNNDAVSPLREGTLQQLENTLQIVAFP